MKQRPCHCCYGTGRELDPVAIGRERRRLRRRLGLSLRYVAERMGISACYLSHLERGLRNWTPQLMTSFNRSLDR